MAFTTVAQLVADLTALDVEGIAATIDHPPNRVTTAEIPLLFVGFPEASGAAGSFMGSGGQIKVSIDVVVLVAPVLHNTNDQNYGKAALIMDNLIVEFESKYLLLGIDSWESKMSTSQVGDTTYWTILSTLLVSR